MGGGARGPSIVETLWDTICSFDRLLYLLLVLDLILLMLSIFALAFVDRNSSSYVVLQFDFVILLTLFALTVYPLYRCRGS